MCLAHRMICAVFRTLQLMESKTMCLLLQIRCKAVEWHPDVATQMVLASEDDRYPVIQVCSN